LAAIGLIAAGLVALTFSPPARGQAGTPVRGQGDIALYWAEVRRIHSGQGYYDAAAAELTGRGYPTRSVWNWRMPLPMWLLGRLPDPRLGKAMLGLLAVALLLAAFAALARQTPTAGRDGAICALLLTGPLGFCALDGLYVSPCLWSGVWIGLSLAAYGLGRRGWGVAAGLAALAFRELALPYCLVCAALAVARRRWPEGIAWGLGFLGFAAFLGLHCVQVGPRIPADAHAHAQGWVQFLGAAFVIATAQMNLYLLLCPQWVAALYLTAALVGFAGWNTELGQRAGVTAALFVVGFACVGQEFNQYWGVLIAPLLCFGAARFPASLAELCRAAVASERQAAGGPSALSTLD
jgi:hypothetical protein